MFVLITAAMATHVALAKQISALPKIHPYFLLPMFLCFTLYGSNAYPTGVILCLTPEPWYDLALAIKIVPPFLGYHTSSRLVAEHLYCH